MTVYITSMVLISCGKCVISEVPDQFDVGHHSGCNSCWEVQEVRAYVYDVMIDFLGEAKD
jgi:hypothetical protein